MAISEIDNRLDNLLFAGLIMLLVFAPLPLGSNRAWAWSILESGLFLGVAVWAALRIARPVARPQALKQAQAPLLLLLLWVVYTFVQAAPMPPGVLKILSPATYEMYSYAGQSIHSGAGPISMDQGATLAEALKNSSYICAFFLTLTLARTPDRLRVMALALVFVGLAEAVYGLFNTLSGIEYIWWNPKTAYRGFVTGTFINRNHFAGQMEMVIPIGLGLMMADRKMRRYYPTWKAMFRGAVSFPLERRGRMAIYTLIMFAGLFLSASRAGAGSLFFSLGVVLLISFIARGRGSAEVRFAPLVFVLAVLAGVWLGVDGLAERYKQVEVGFEGRATVWASAVNIIGDYPWFGSGAGTFRYIFPLYEKAGIYGFYDHAHNDYLETLTDQGIVGFALLGAAVAILQFRLAKGFVNRRDPLARGILFASLAGVTSIMFHSVFDFNFHIPANATWFFALMGMGISATVVRNNGGRGARDI